MTIQGKEKKINPMAALATGVVIGAGAAIAGATVLKDKKKQAKVKNVLKEVKSQFSEYVDGIQKTMDEKKNVGEEKLAESKKEINEVRESAKDTLDKTKENI